MQWWRAALAALSLAAAAAAAADAPAQAHAQTERGLLELLGLRRRPRADRARVHVPDAMRALYRHFAAGALFLPPHQRSANTVRSFVHQESDVDLRFEGDRRFRLAFNATVPDGETLKAAELVLARDSVGEGGGDGERRHRVTVYDIVAPGVRGSRKPTLRLLDAKAVRGSAGGTVRLDVTGAVERWTWRPAENHGLLVHVSAPEGERRRHVRLRRSPGEPRDEWDARQPVLLAFSDDRRGRELRAPPVAGDEDADADAPRGRSARAAQRRAQRRKSGRDVCQRHSLFVDFNDVGWSDWIVAPKGYQAFYCHGDCPFPMGEHLNTTNHAIIQTLVNSVTPTAVPKACCVPTDLSGISMLYMDEDNKVVLKNYNDMAVVGCGCR